MVLLHIATALAVGATLGWAVTRRTGPVQAGSLRDASLQLVARQRLGRGPELAVVTCADRVLVVSTGREGMQLLSEAPSAFRSDLAVGSRTRFGRQFLAAIEYDSGRTA